MDSRTKKRRSSTQTWAICFLTSAAALAARLPEAAAAAAPPSSSSYEISARRPVRNGFTLELGLGLASMHVFIDRGDTINKLGLAPLSLSLGGFINNNWAILFRAAGTSYFADDARGDLTQIGSYLYGLHVQHWFNDWFMMSAGPGLAMFGRSKAWGPVEDLYTGFGFSVRAGFSFANWENHSLRFAIEVFPSFVEDRYRIVGTALNFEWQWF